MLEMCGFGARWRSWVFFYISTVCFLVLINGTPYGFFNSFRDLDKVIVISSIVCPSYGDSKQVDG
jgi:hypothetical protein